MAAMQNSRISLISKSDIRYEGTLFSINPEENTVALRNVRMLGTEDRRTGPGAVQGSEQTYEYIVFRGSDIKDLTVFEQVSQNQNMLPPDPAILSGAPAGRGGNFSNQGQRNQSGNRPNFSQGQGQNRGGPLRMFDREQSGGQRGENRGGDRGGYGDRNRDRGYDNRDRGDRNVRSYDNRDRGYDNRRGGDRNDNRRGGYDNRRGGDNRNDNRRGGDRRGPGGAGSAGGQGGFGGQSGFGRNRNGNLHTGQNFQPSANPSNEYKEEFDFATANQSLDKDKLAEEFVTKATTAAAPAAGEEPKGTNAKSVYTPKNFFDELSCEALDAKQGTASKPPDREAREAQKKTDADTFGDAAFNVAGYGYGGRRRGMGRGRGRGRGGHGGRRY